MPPAGTAGGRRRCWSAARGTSRRTRRRPRTGSTSRRSRPGPGDRPRRPRPGAASTSGRPNCAAEAWPYAAVGSTLPKVRSFEAGTRIDASPADVWALLSDVGGWRDWDSGVDRVEGRVALGERLTIYATMIRNRPFTVTVTEIRPQEVMRWRGGLSFGLRSEEHTSELQSRLHLV